MFSCRHTVVKSTFLKFKSLARAVFVPDLAPTRGSVLRRTRSSETIAANNGLGGHVLVSSVMRDAFPAAAVL